MTTIVHLLFSRSPAAIARLIIAIIIDSINTVFARWPYTHICEKVFEGVTPAVANFNTASTVIFIRVVVRIIATLCHPTPYPKLASMGRAVSFIRINSLQQFYRFAAKLTRQTSTTSSLTSGKNFTKGRNDFAAIALASPICSPTNTGRVSANEAIEIQYKQSPESLTSKINTAIFVPFWSSHKSRIYYQLACGVND